MDRATCTAFKYTTNQGIGDRQRWIVKKPENARVPRAYARYSLNQARKFSNAKTAVFRERCGE
jgi:hypothetical protein